MSYTTKRIVLNVPTHKVVSYGNGAAYAVVRKTTGQSFFIQDEAASEFRETVFDQDLFNFADIIELHYSDCFSANCNQEERLDR